MNTRLKNLIGGRPLLTGAIVLLIAALIEYVVHTPRFGMSAGLAAFLGFSLLLYLLHNGYSFKKIVASGFGFTVSVEGLAAPWEQSPEDRKETVKDYIFGLEFSGDVVESGSNSDGYWYRYSNEVQIARSRCKSTNAREWVTFPQTFASAPEVLVNSDAYALDTSSVTAEGFYVDKRGEHEHESEIRYFAIGMWI
ncbi:hypothetical protein E4656_19985 [Natronospirillum operosum]|uniref:Uncharacterized protein n=1 Tax=Natronospirillum operosum TaxID=2759953 RepID=A0A4Z0W4A3_9GAMM|nr:hypothetical protein [Natronospirillum operosum]TGG89397.1 hypothetical protein E4656_19985 [Natronospirillum operosum]